MSHTLILYAVLASAGLLAGSLVVFTAPRLAAYRLREPAPFPGVIVLLPVAGAVLTGWRPARAVATQVFCGAVFIALGAHYGSSVQLPVACFYSALLIAIAYVDLDHRLVLNRLSYPGVVVALLLSFLWPGIGIGSALLGALLGLIGFGALEILGRGALGRGDTKLAILIGAMRGAPTVVNALILGVILGGIAAALLLFAFRKGRRDYIAYAPYLSAGAMLSFFFAHP